MLIDERQCQGFVREMKAALIDRQTRLGLPQRRLVELAGEFIEVESRKCSDRLQLDTANSAAKKAPATPPHSVSKVGSIDGIHIRWATEGRSSGRHATRLRDGSHAGAQAGKQSRIGVVIHSRGILGRTLRVVQLSVRLSAISPMISN